MNRSLSLLALLLALALLAPAAALAAPAGSTFLVSRPDGTGPVAPAGDNGSFGPLAVSPEGRYVAFASDADGFAPGADSRVANVFLRDTATGVTTLVSRSDGPNGVGANANVGVFDEAQIGIAVEPGAQMQDAPHNQQHVLVVFSTKATNLVDHADRAVPATGGREEVWMRDVTAGATYLVSRASGLGGEPGDGRSWQPSIAAGPRGPLVAFASEARNLGRFGVEGTVSKVWLREMGEGVTHLVSCAFRNCGGNSSQGRSSEPSLRFVHGLPGLESCPEGQCALVAFSTADPTIADIAENRSQVVLARAVEKIGGSGLAEFSHWETQSTVMQDPAHDGNGNSYDPTVMPDGSTVAFVSDSSNLVPYPFGPPLPAFVPQAYFHIPPDGTLLLSETPAPPIPGNPGLLAADQAIQSVSVGGSLPGGMRIAFDTTSTVFGAPLDNDFERLRAYQYERARGWPSIVDRAAGPDGVLGDRRSWGPVLSADGSTVAYLSLSDNLGAGGGRDFARVYARRVDPAAPDYGSVQLASRPTGTGAFPWGSKRSAVVSRSTSADGRYVAFESNADDLSGADDDRLANVYVRDTVKGTTALVSRAGGANGAAADADSHLGGISDDGRRVLFTTRAGNLGFSLGPERAYVRDVAAQTTTLASRANGPAGTAVQGTEVSISGDGNRVAFMSGQVVDPEAANGVPHLYVRDLAAQTTTFVDRANGVTGEPAWAFPEAASLDRDGSRVAWTTEARLPGSGATGTEAKAYLRDLDAGTTTLVSRADGATGAEANGDSFAPSIDAAGDAVAFESEASNLGPVSAHSIWVRRLSAGRTELVSRAGGAAGAPADRLSFLPSIDAAGDRVAFVSNADLGEGEAVGGFLAYVRDLGSKTTIVASRVNGADGALASPAGFGGVSLSASGDCIAFAGTGVNYTDQLAGADFPAVRERVLRGSCGPATSPAAAEAPPAAPEAAPRLSALSMSSTRFYVGRGGGTTISFRLDRPARVVLAFERLAGGARSSNAAAVRVGRIAVAGHAGRNTVRFSGRVHGRALAPGRYRWTATPLRGKGRSGRFTVIPAPRRARRGG